MKKDWDLHCHFRHGFRSGGTQIYAVSEKCISVASVFSAGASAEVPVGDGKKKENSAAKGGK